MKKTLQETGYVPVEIEYTRSIQSTMMLDGDKRGVELTVFLLENGGWAGRLTYITNWGSEQPFTQLFDSDRLSGAGFMVPPLDSMLRDAAKRVLPPGAGYPAMPQFETRQAKLQGMLETLTLVALSDVLRQVSDQKSS